MASQVDAVPVILFSADRQATSEAECDESERSHAAGFSSVLSKPFDLNELVRVVALAVSQSPVSPGIDGLGCSIRPRWRSWANRQCSRARCYGGGLTPSRRAGPWSLPSRSSSTRLRVGRPWRRCCSMA